jgi:two-component system, NtrC family, sensor kinase
MTLRNRLLVTTSAMIVSLLTVTGASLWVVSSIAGSLGWVAGEYNELRLIDQAGNDLAAVSGLLRSDKPDFELIDARLDSATHRLRDYVQIQGGDEYGLGQATAEHQDAEDRTTLTIARALESIADKARMLRLKTASARPDVGVTDEVIAEMSNTVTRIRSDLEALAGEGDIAVLDAHERVRTVLGRTVLVLLGVCLSAAVIVSISGLVQYRAVVPPLARMRDRVREIASGRFDQRVTHCGKDEFADLAADFNRMVAELEALYQNLEARVETKSQQLVRSERLASVGYLAAGIAHEINNPLSIIAGYAELAIKDLRAKSDDAESLQGLEIIRDEAFRCKLIIEKLLSLMHSPDAPHGKVSLASVAHDVAGMVRGLKQFNNRELEIQIDPALPLDVMAHEAEMKQVLLNLTINAMQAVSDQHGRVRVIGSLNHDQVELSVIDNGHGMSANALAHAFEPFYTEKRGTHEQGNGLGLSIVHAIIQDHGGRIEAHSDGPGQGSRFTLFLPSAGKRTTENNHDRSDADTSIA